MKIMAVDLGDARTGLAVCDRTEFLASPVGVIHDRVFESILNKVAIATKEYDVKKVVVGYPVNMNGTVGERAEKCERFAGHRRGGRHPDSGELSCLAQEPPGPGLD